MVNHIISCPKETDKFGGKIVGQVEKALDINGKPAPVVKIIRIMEEDDGIPNAPESFEDVDNGEKTVTDPRADLRIPDGKERFKDFGAWQLRKEHRTQPRIMPTDSDGDRASWRSADGDDRWMPTFVTDESSSEEASDEVIPKDDMESGYSSNEEEGYISDSSYRHPLPGLNPPRWPKKQASSPLMDGYISDSSYEHPLPEPNTPRWPKKQASSPLMKAM